MFIVIEVQTELELFCVFILLLPFCVRLQPDFKAIKKRIEDLITRDYIERDKDNPQLFRYLA